MTGLLFGVDLSTSAGPGADPVRDATAAERLGFDFVSASDHSEGSSPTFETWTLLTWVAAATSRIGIASRVLGVPYRPPAMVAKMAETLDRLAGGRLVLGLGGGYADQEFRAFGLTVPSPRDKVDGMAEAIEITRGLWTRRGFTYGGRLYRTDAAELEPKPARRIPIWLGAFGPRALAVTGRLADGWIPSFGFAPPDRVTGMRARVMAAARDAGRDPGMITCCYNLRVRITDHPGGGPADVAGPPEAVAERLAELVGLGFDALNLMPLGPGEDEQVERLAREVVPAVRAAARPLG